MTRFGFVLDQRSCIGCHACTVACKQEHDIELGVFRTWVKYIEQGSFPDARRYFSVLRCNHCDDAPCVEVCPVTALYKREDGIVDFDSALPRTTWAAGGSRRTAGTNAGPARWSTWSKTATP